MRYIYLPLCLLSLLFSGCDKDTQSLDREEERSALMQKGQAYMDIKDYAQAEAAFKQAITIDPTMARPYLDLATIYHQYKIDYFSAIYCYNRYLELRPDSEKTQFIKEQIAKVQQSLANNILTRSGATRLSQTVQRLQQENTILKQQITTLKKQASTPVTPPTVAVTPKTDQTPVAPNGAQTHQIYTVVSGDTLSKISRKYYNDSSKWDIIYDANRDRMKNAGDLRVGQTLVIPAKP
jgi:tetratricopeptide (TPR) repeat protein